MSYINLVFVEIDFFYGYSNKEVQAGVNHFDITTEQKTFLLLNTVVSVESFQFCYLSRETWYARNLKIAVMR